MALVPDRSRRRLCQGILAALAVPMTLKATPAPLVSGTPSRVLSLAAVGDIILGGPDPDSHFALAAPVLREADVLVGQVEAPFTARPVESYYVEVPGEIYATSACNPANIGALARAGFDVMTLAGNHIWDSGVPGIVDTLEGLRNRGIAAVGAGMNIREAREPVIIQRDETRFGFLNYNCTGPKLGWATPDKPGCAYIHVTVAYELEHPTPGGAPTAYALALPPSIEEMNRDIRQLRERCDVLTVCFHKGIGFVPAILAMYEQQVSYAAIDAGADLVIGHHAHMLRGVEFHRGKPIFHGLGHFVVSKPPRAAGQASRWAVRQFVDRHLQNLGEYVQPDPAWPNHPYHPETLNTMIARCSVVSGQISEVALHPCLINVAGQPVVLGRSDGGEALVDYLRAITRTAQLNARYEWADDRVVVEADSST